ncbi:MAG TPA: hypothetical protein G4O13_07730 [Dehalococcoidia bacterium]|nr:hypothetical protein [Dehalococcoidia bacterium]
MEEQLGRKLGKGKVSPEILNTYREEVAPKVLHTIVRGLIQGVMELDEESRNRVLEKMGYACYKGFEEFVGTPPTGVEIETACEWLNDTVPHNRRFEKAGDTIYWDADIEDTYGGCMCVLVRLGIVEPRPELCICATNYCKRAFEEMTGKPVEGEMVETVSSGSRNCIFRYHFQPTPYSSRRSK